MCTAPKCLQKMLVADEFQQQQPEHAVDAGIDSASEVYGEQQVQYLKTEQLTKQSEVVL